jgi:hypothetical protein
MNNYLLATLIVLGTAVVVSAYQYTTNETENPKKTFATTVVAGAAVSAAIIYFGCQKPKVSTEPFTMDAPQPPAQPVAQSVAMPTT